MNSSIRHQMPRIGKRTLFLGALLMLLLVFGNAGYAQEPQPEASEGEARPPIGNQSIVHGAHIPPIWQNNTEVTAYNQLVGKNAGIVMVFYGWSRTFEDFTCGFFDNTYRPRNDGGTPNVNECMKDFNPNTPEVDTTIMITWEPKSNPTGALACNVAPNGVTDFNAIINGSCNAYIDDFARRLKSWHDRFGDRFIIRFMHEMNIQSSAWFHDDPNYPAQYRQAFQHVYNRFRAQGVSRDAAQFMWSPNWASHPPRDWNTIPAYYPGDQYVEWIGLSGYNWYGANGQDPTWRTFDNLFVDPIPELGMGVLPYLHCNYAKPIAIAEFGTVDGPGGARTKTAWLANTYERMLDFPYIRAAVIFNDYAFASQNNADFRVTEGSSYIDRGNSWPPSPGFQRSLGAVTDTYRNEIANSRYVATMPSLADLTPATTYCGAFPPVYLPPTISLPSQVPVEQGATTTVGAIGQHIEGAYTLTATNVSGGLSVQFVPNQITPGSPQVAIRITAPRAMEPTMATMTIRGQSQNPNYESFSKTITVHVVGELYQTFLPTTRR